MTNNAETTETTVATSGASAIRTRFYGAGNVRGERITAWRADESAPRDDVDAEGNKMATTVSYDYGLDVAENHAAAVAAYVAKRNAAGHDWSGRWVLGSGTDGYFAVKAAR